jgi:protein-tyrosine phosphatase
VRRVPGYSLWLGHVGDVRDLHGIHAAGILAVVDLALNELPASLTRDLVYCRFPLIDGTGNPGWLLRAAVETVAGLLRCDTPTLVYCGAGMSRSPCIAAAAIARVRGCPPAEGLAIALQSAAADVSPGLWTEIQDIL